MRSSRIIIRSLLVHNEKEVMEAVTVELSDVYSSQKESHVDRVIEGSQEAMCSRGQVGG